MKLHEILKMALENIKANKMRSILTMLGIIIGISSVITILSLGKGGKKSILGELEKIGSSSIQIKVDMNKATKNDYFTLKDIQILKSKSSNIKYVAPLVVFQGNSKLNDKIKQCIIYCSTNEFNYIQNNQIKHGRFFTKKEIDEKSSVCIIDDLTAKYYWGYSNVIGQDLTIMRGNLTKKIKVIGVYKSASYIMGAPIEKIPAFITVPITYSTNLSNKMFQIDSIYLMADSKENVENANYEAIRILEARHNNKGKKIYTGEKLLKQVQEINNVIGIFTSFIGAVAGISLIVGGIGVMNIMLVSVTERTKEIGIRKAIGATTKDIMTQFLIEAIIISLLGGIIGMILGISMAFIIGYFTKVLPVISILDVIIVIVFSTFIGMFFGIYPAKKAAKLNPIDALRYE